LIQIIPPAGTPFNLAIRSEHQLAPLQIEQE